MTESEVERVENEIGDLPEYYRAWLLSLPPSFDKETASRIWSVVGHVYNTPEAILNANLALVDSAWLEDTEWSDVELSDYVVIGGDGCGNYYIIDPDDEDSPVQLLAHDPVSLEDRFESVQEYCDALTEVIQE